MASRKKDKAEATDQEFELIRRNLTKECLANEDYDSRVEIDRSEGRMVSIPETEWKNSVLQNYFVMYLFNLGLEFFPEYSKAKESAEQAYQMTFRIAGRTKDRLEKKFDSAAKDKE